MVGLVTKVWAGIDWGTHSSKWVCHVEGSDSTGSAKIHSSALLRTEAALMLSASDEPPRGGELIESLKGKIMSDPLGQSFWDADRADTRCSLGEAVTFSLCSLLGAINSQLQRERGFNLGQNTRVCLGFSMPNWLRDRDNSSQAALTHFHQATRTTCHILSSGGTAGLPVPGTAYPISRWKDVVERSRHDCPVDGTSISVETMTQEVHELGFVAWSYLVESCAAGLPYLRSITPLIEDNSPPGVPGLGKLLVVDVGAGSTDVGYMLRTLNRQEQSENLFYFPPAGTFPVAGNDLTERVYQYLLQQGRAVTKEEAEAFKLSEGSWHELEFANDWRQRIGRHVKEYVRGIPDQRWLPLKVPLHVIVTGGSGVVPGLKTEIREAVYKGLVERDVTDPVATGTQIIGEAIPGWTFGRQAEYARMAVAIGASDNDKPSLRYCPKLDPPVYVRTKTVRY